jgi:alpha-tubulin suppressor-like RCC1 family protein
VSGRAKCWGDNPNGQLGDGSIIQRHLPVKVMNSTGSAPLESVVEIVVPEFGFHTCAKLTNHQAMCWGSNGTGELGDNTIQERHLPVSVKNAAGTGPLAGVSHITVGGAHSCALIGTSAVCWGRNDSGQLGDGTIAQRNLPVTVKNPAGTGPLTGVLQIDGGAVDSCARLVFGLAECWGNRFFGELGDGYALSTSSPKPLPALVMNEPGTGPLPIVAQVAAGFGDGCFRSTTLSVDCTGTNTDGQLGNGTVLTPWAFPTIVIV